MDTSENNTQTSWEKRTHGTPSSGVAVSSQQVAIEKEAGDTYRVKITAGTQAKAGELSAIPGAIKNQGYKNTYVDVANGKHVLISHNLSKQQARDLIAWLESEHLIADSSVSDQSARKAHEAANRIRRDSLKWSGRLAMAGSAAVAAAGLGQKDWKRLQTGITLMAADSVVAVYGNGKGSIDFDHLFRDMHEHFQQNGINLPDIATPEARKNSIEKVSQFIAQHPIELNYGLGMLSGIGHMSSGFTDYRRSGAGISRMAKGALGAGGSAAVIFIPEQKEKPESKSLRYYASHPAEIPGGISNLVFASPMRFKGIISSIYSMLYFTDTLEEKKKMKLWANEKGGLYNGKSHEALTSELGSIVNSSAMRNKEAKAIKQAGELRKGLSELERRERIAKTKFGGVISPYLSTFTAVAYIAASLLAASSSRNRDTSFEQDSEYEPLYAMAAQTVAMLPKEDRQNALTQMATYLSAQEDVKDGAINAPKIVEEVSERLNSIDQSPWLESNKNIAHTIT